MLGSLSAAAIDLYVAAFLARCEAMRRLDRPTIDEPGVRGRLASSEDPRVRLLVTDDRAHDVLTEVAPRAGAGMISVLGRATRCHRLMGAQLGWRSEVVTAMVCHDLRRIPSVSLPSELTLRPVRRLPADEPTGIALPDAVAAAIRAAPAIEDPPQRFADYLRSLAPTFRLFAAVDREETVRATSGSGVFGRHATVFFVGTDPEWRRRGIGQAMTAHALTAARDAGAIHACLDASAAGRSIYRRLGFEPAGTLTQFSAPT